MDTRYLLIGGGLASSQAAKTIRRKDPEGSITLVTAEAFLPYDRPPLSKEFLRGEKSREQIIYDDAAALAAQKVDCRLETVVERLDLEKKAAVLGDGGRIGFDKAFIATGGRPIRLNLPGADLPEVFYLRNLDDAAAIGAQAGAGKRAVLIGAGFIGMEVAASLTRMGVAVTVVEAASHIWARFADATLAGFFQQYCAGKGIVFMTNDTVAEIQGDGRVTGVTTKSGRRIPCDFVCIGVGIRPNVEIAQASGLEVNNGIVVNEYMQASHPDVYAAGDVVNYYDPVFGKRRRVEHWGHAEYGGQIAGMNMAGERHAYTLLTYVWSDIFDLHLEFAGDESEHDQVLVRGKMDDGSFIVLFLKNHLLAAYFAVNTNAREFRTYQRMIQQKTDLAGKEARLQDTSVNVRDLLG
jgi:NADPH-dependent 2,4-dienoyl-CoA reductase/sulfur reductase-like enzyme